MQGLLRTADFDADKFAVIPVEQPMLMWQEKLQLFIIWPSQRLLIASDDSFV